MVTAMILGLGWRSLPPMCLSYTMRRRRQPSAVVIRNAAGHGEWMGSGDARPPKRLALVANRSNRPLAMRFTG